MAPFSKALNRVDIEQGVVFDRQCAASLPPLGSGQMNLSVTDGKNVWQFLYSLTATGNPKFTGGLIEFSRNLNPGNKVYFYDNADAATGAQYKVVVRG